MILSAPRDLATTLPNWIGDVMLPLNLHLAHPSGRKPSNCLQVCGAGIAAALASVAEAE